MPSETLAPPKRNISKRAFSSPNIAQLHQKKKGKNPRTKGSTTKKKKLGGRRIYGEKFDSLGHRCKNFGGKRKGNIKGTTKRGWWRKPEPASNSKTAGSETDMERSKAGATLFQGQVTV